MRRRSIARAQSGRPLLGLARSPALAQALALAAALGMISACRAPSREAAAPAAGGAAPSGSAPIMADATVLSADGVPIHYHAEGAGEPAILFVHCWSCDGGFWDAQVRYFAPSHRVVTLDLAGHGASGLGRARYTVEAFGEDVKAVAEALDLRRVVLVGHSMGGPVALEAARRMPDRVVALVPIDTLQNADFRFKPEELQAFLGGFRRDFASATRDLVRQIVPPGADPAIVASIGDRMSRASPEVGLSAMQEMFAYDVPAALRAVKMPIRAVNSDMRPTLLEVNRRYAPQFDAVIMKGVGHFPMIEAPDAFNQILEQVVRDVAATAPGRV